MRSIEEYLDLAKARADIKSDRQLGPAIGQSTQTVTHYRRKNAWPSDDAMLRLADLAGIPREEALLDLACWRSTSHARPTWQAIAAKLAAVAPAAFLTAVLPTLVAAAFFAGATPSPANAGTAGEQPRISVDPLNIMTNFIKLERGRQGVRKRLISRGFS